MQKYLQVNFALSFRKIKKEYAENVSNKEGCGTRTFCRKTLCRRTFCRTDILPTVILPNGRFAGRTSCRTDSLPKEQPAENKECYFVIKFGTVTHFSTVYFSTIV
jgi:hypothetical protein